ncbi:MAG: CerR family C-terminal domain-containing protein [Thermoanaerobaculia bacterium]|nr:CerR family C-terminal domain-containing protein [Thermoanaerobaculia bacterium]
MSQNPDPNSPPAEAQDTKDRLIEAGMAVFAERGFADAGLREICAQAGANPAAVNYHFGDKQRFYTEVLATCHQRAASHRPVPRIADDPDRPDVVLGRFVRWFLELLLVSSENDYLGRLMAREMVSPSPSLLEMVRRSLLPIKAVLEEILRALLPPDVDDQTLGLCFASTISQCLFYKHNQPVFQAMERIRATGREDERLQAEFPDRNDLDELAEHITRFALAGLRAAGYETDHR